MTTTNNKFPNFTAFTCRYTCDWVYDTELRIERWYSEAGGFCWHWWVMYNGQAIDDRGFDANGFSTAEEAWYDMQEKIYPPEEYRDRVREMRYLKKDGPIMSSDIMSVAEAAKELGVSAQRVRVLIEKGKLDAYKPQGRWVLDARSVKRRAFEQSPLGKLMQGPEEKADDPE